MLLPRFDRIPGELTGISRWVTWAGKKIPYCAHDAGRKASVTDPSTWANFQQAQADYLRKDRQGVGLVLNGDGLVGIDLDSCVHDGRPDPKALEILKRIGCQYVELSPSGTGLRSFGVAKPPKRCKGRIDGIEVELYATGRYLTVTGHVLHSGPADDPLMGFVDLSEELSPTQEHTGSTQDDTCHPVFSCVGIPQHTLPSEVGQRNKRLFEFARYLKGITPGATKAELRLLVTEWHRQALPHIGTTDFMETWADFMRGWEKVRRPFGEVMNLILDGVDDDPLPAGIEALGYGKRGQKLVKICKRLADHHAPEPFFLGARQAGDLLGIHFTDASKLLAALVFDDVLKLVKKGSGKRASEYTWVAQSQI